MKAQTFIALLLCFHEVNAHPPVNVHRGSKEYRDFVGPAVATFKNISTSHLMPYQETSVRMVTTAKKQNVNGVNIFLSLVVQEDMVFQGPGRGWPTWELHEVRMYTPFGEKPVFQMNGDTVPPKIQIIDKTSHHIEVSCRQRCSIEKMCERIHMSD